MANDTTVLITGGGGFIGNHVTRALLNHDLRVRIFDNLYHADRENLAELETMGVEFIDGSVTYRGAVGQAMKGVNQVIHLAAVAINKSLDSPEESLMVNLIGSQHVFQQAVEQGVDRIVFASSASVYGEPDALPQSEDHSPKPQTPYCISKLASEHLLQFYGSRNPLSWIALRFFNVYGPGQQTDAYYTSVILTFLRRIAGGQVPIIDGKGDQSVDFVHVSDVASAIVMSLLSDVSGEVINIGTGVSTTIAELASILTREMGFDGAPQFRPREVLVSRRAADISKAARILGWSPKIDAETGLSELAADFKAGRVK